jgi:hypothetical protein
VPTQIEQDAVAVLEELVNAGIAQEAAGDIDQVSGELEAEQLAERLAIPPSRLNDAAAFLEREAFAEVTRTLGTAPFDFRWIAATPFGRFEYQKIQLASRDAERDVTGHGPAAALRVSPVPVGSPFGFTDLDWEFVSAERARLDKLKVVVGYQFKSEWFDWERLRANLVRHFAYAVAQYSVAPGNSDITLNFAPLSAGYGEHLFNEIARHVISADIAVFETSDFNPNVMIEMGVALTWGIRVMPIRAMGRPIPPSDMSGQTWVDYENSGDSFPDPDHGAKLLGMVERAMRRKRAST